MPIFMKAGSIKGDVVASSHKDWVELDSCAFELEFEEDDVRKSLGEGAPQPQLDTFDLVKKKPDRSGPALMKWMIDGDVLDEVTIEVCGDTLFDGNWRCHVRYKLEQVELTGYGMNMSDAEKGEASITMKLTFKKMGIEHTSYDRANAQRTSSKPISFERLA